MDKQNKKPAELTPEQMSRVSGGKATGNDCSKSPDGFHRFSVQTDGTKRCIYCLAIAKKSYEIF